MMLFGNIASVKSLTTSKPMSLRYLRKIYGVNPVCSPVVPQRAEILSLFYPHRTTRASLIIP